MEVYSTSRSSRASVVVVVLMVVVVGGGSSAEQSLISHDSMSTMALALGPNTTGVCPKCD